MKLIQSRAAIAILSTSNMKSLVCLVVFALAVSRLNAKAVIGLGQSAFDFIQAESANDFHNATITSICGITCATDLNDDDYLRFDNVDFGSGASNVVLHYYNPDPSTSVHVATVYIDSPLTESLATIYLLSTESCCGFKEQAQGLNRIPTGIHTLYLTFTSDNPTENILNLDYIVFTA
ncbi:hypothetical protein CHUAL_008860 [Chamberlinius hualienensis]